MLNFATKENVKMYEKYIINAFNYTVKNMTLDWCHNYMSKNLTMFFWSLHMHFANIIRRFKMTSIIHGAKEHEARGN
jgi:hypothetical protein